MRWRIRVMRTQREALDEYDNFSHISQRRYVAPNFAEIRHILNISQVLLSPALPPLCRHRRRAQLAARHARDALHCPPRCMHA
jgi:hypothetical protein